jgi:hypothetical protein
MPTLHQPQVVNAVAHFGAALIFGIFLILLVKDRASARTGASWLSLAAAGLAFAWNLGSLVALVVPPRNASAVEVLTALNFCTLSLLPAVLLQLCLQESGMRTLVVTGYVTGVLAVGLHLMELLRPDLAVHQVALTAVTVGFAVLTAVSVYLFLRMGARTDRRRMARILGSMCLALLAISFAHFGHAHPPQPWSKELVLHHASLPLALFILLQDDRFILLDAFVRFLANVLLAALMTFLVLKSAARIFPASTLVQGDALREAVLFAAIAFLLILFAFLRGIFQRWLTRTVFRRGDLEKAIRDIRNLQGRDEAGFLAAAAERTAAFAGAGRCEVLGSGPIVDSLLEREVFYTLPAVDLPRLQASVPGWVNAVVPLRLSKGGTQYLLLGRRRGGRRYLSEDLVALSRLATVIVDEMGRLRDAEMQRLMSAAELRALQSQINPHFLFNALNTLYGIIPREAAGARRTVLNLSEIFRYFLRMDRTYIPLAEELKIVTAYLEIERLRLGPRLETQIDVDESVLSIPVPALSIQPLVENSVKHGLSPKPEGGRLTVAARLLNGELRVSVEDTGAGMGGHTDEGSGGEGVGMMNVRRRLHLCYGPQYGLTVQSGASGTHVEFAVPLAPAGVR